MYVLNVLCLLLGMIYLFVFAYYHHCGIYCLS